MDNQQLYTIIMKDSKQPFLVDSDDILLLYENKKAAEIAAKDLETKRLYTPLLVKDIDDPKEFIKQMVASGIVKFLLNGKGNILKATDFGLDESELPRRRNDGLYYAIKNVQPASRTPIPSNTGGRKKDEGAPYLLIIAIIVILIAVGISKSGTGSSKKKTKMPSPPPIPTYHVSSVDMDSFKEGMNQKMISPSSPSTYVLDDEDIQKIFRNGSDE